MKKILPLISVLLLCSFSLFSHVVDYELDKMSQAQVFWQYIVVGFTHILPLGVDHIFFILCVFFMNSTIKQIVLQASMFTLAHSITLALAVFGVINPPAHIIEPLIALSIVFLAIENIYSTRVKPWRIVMVFLFGLVHGMGFAGALSELGLPKYAFVNALISFNIGVELGQITIIIVMYFLMKQFFTNQLLYRKRVVIPVSLGIALIASYWTIERIFLV